MKRILALLTLAVLSTSATAIAHQPVEARCLGSDGESKRCGNVTPQTERPRMDVVFAIDATSSMADEIEVIKKEVWAIANKLITGKPAPDIRFGLVLYRDTTDQKLVEVTPLTRDIDKVHELLMSAQAVGGGNKPEHIGKGLHASLDLEWDLADGVKRTIYLVGDAGANPHPEFTVASALDRARQMNVTINAIGCSGLTVAERNELTQIASNTGGGFDALTYYAVVEDAAGKKKSVVYYDGEMYETEGEISADEWKKGGDKVIAKRKMRKASRDVRSRASSAKKTNNLDAALADDMMESAASMGVEY
jgi:hypothetical protein